MSQRAGLGSSVNSHGISLTLGSSTHPRLERVSQSRACVRTRHDVRFQAVCVSGEMGMRGTGVGRCRVSTPHVG